MAVCTRCGKPLEETDAGNDGLCGRCRSNPLALPKAAPAARGGVLKWLVGGFFALLGLAVVLAESGAVTAEKTETKWAADGKNESESEWSGPRGRAVPLRGVGFTPKATAAAQRDPGGDIARLAASAINKSPARPGEGESKLEITITRVAPAGAFWVPFMKDGSCTFTATYVLAAETPWARFAARGEVSGSVTQSMRGFGSTDLFRQKVADAISAAVLNDIARLIAKHS